MDDAETSENDRGDTPLSTSHTTSPVPNTLALWGFWVAVVSYFVYEVGIVPIVALGLSIGAVVRHDDMRQSATHKKLGIAGIVLSSVSTLLYLSAYGHV